MSTETAPVTGAIVPGTIAFCPLRPRLMAKELGVWMWNAILGAPATVRLGCGVCGHQGNS